MEGDWKKLKIVSMEKARVAPQRLSYPPTIGVEAKEYFSKSRNRYGFASNVFGDITEARKFVETLYEAGAVKVVVTGIYNEPWRIRQEGDIYADTLLVTIRPANQEKIIEIIKSKQPDELDWVGQNTLRLWWD